MSVLIRGMKMPEEGEYHMTLYVCSDGSAYIDVASFPVDKDRFEAVSIPPHGRLIDADALDTEILQAGFSYALTRRKLRYTPGDVRQKIANAPTIIPAEEGEAEE